MIPPSHEPWKMEMKIDILCMLLVIAALYIFVYIYFSTYLLIVLSTSSILPALQLFSQLFCLFLCKYCTLRVHTFWVNKADSDITSPALFEKITSGIAIIWYCIQAKFHWITHSQQSCFVHKIFNYIRVEIRNHYTCNTGWGDHFQPTPSVTQPPRGVRGQFSPGEFFRSLTAKQTNFQAF